MSWSKICEYLETISVFEPKNQLIETSLTLSRGVACAKT